MTNEEAAKIIEGIEEVQGKLPEDGLLVEEALSTAIAVLRGDKPIGKWIKTTATFGTATLATSAARNPITEKTSNPDAVLT